MAYSITFNTSFTGTGVAVAGYSQTVISAESQQGANPDLPPALSATLTIRTNDTSGSLTMADADHGIETGDRIDLYWSGGQCYGAVAGTVAGSVVPIASVAGGDNLPIATTVIKVGVPEPVAVEFAGDDLDAIAITSDSARAYVVLHDGTYNRLVVYLTPGESYFWHNEMGTDNPLATFDLTNVFISHGDPDRTITTVKLVVFAPPA